VLNDLSAEELLLAIADGLETTMLPALAGANERRQCRAATFLVRGVAGALMAAIGQQ
jgi:hypothetical protein